MPARVLLRDSKAWDCSTFQESGLSTIGDTLPHPGNVRAEQRQNSATVSGHHQMILRMSKFTWRLRLSMQSVFRQSALLPLPASLQVQPRLACPGFLLLVQKFRAVGTADFA